LDAVSNAELVIWDTDNWRQYNLGTSSDNIGSAATGAIVAKWGSNPFEKMREERAVAGASKAALLDKVKDQARRAKEANAAEVAKAGRFDDLDLDRFSTAASRLRLRQADDASGVTHILNRPTCALLDQFASSLKAGTGATALLQWPTGIRDISILHPLAMLPVLQNRPSQIENGHQFCDPVLDFRTLYFPWRGGGTGADQRRWLVDREAVLTVNRPHLTRRHLQKAEATPELGSLHEMLGHMSLLRRREAAFPHLSHPALSELYPLFSADGDTAITPPFDAAIHELYGRVRYGAGMSELPDHRPNLVDPSDAPFGFFGVTARANLRVALAHRAISKKVGGRPPDICLLDLCYPALNRLGYGWEEHVARFFEELLTVFPRMPIFAVTQDAFVQRRVAFLLSRCKAARKLDRTGMERPVLLRRSGDLVTPDPAILPVTPIKASFQSSVGPSSEAITAINEAARGCSDASVAGSLRRSAANVRRAAALPCGLDEAYRLLCEIDGEPAAQALLEDRAESSVLLPIRRALDSGIGGAERVRLIAAETAVRNAYAALATETPIGSALSTLAQRLARASTFGIVAFANEMDLRLARARFAGNETVAGVLRDRLERGKTRITHTGALEDVLIELEASNDRNSWKRLILIAPPLGFLDRLMVRSWVPEDVLILSDRAFAVRAAGAYAALAAQAGFGGTSLVGDRLKVIAAAAKAEAEARAVGTVDLELAARPPVDVPDTVVDLTDGEATATEAWFVHLESGRCLRGRPGSTVVRFARNAPVNPFDRTNVRGLSSGDAIVVPDRAFVDAARRVLPLQVLAQGWVKVYHDLIVAALPNLPGNSLSHKARLLFAELQKKHVSITSTATVQEWLRAEEHRKEPAELIRPHAPLQRGDFVAFMRLIGAPDMWIDKIWEEGISQLRVDRRRAGFRMAQAFISVLVDPHGAPTALDAEVRRGIAELNERALDHLDVVVAVEPPTGGA
jgi:hypothetical protein